MNCIRLFFFINKNVIVCEIKNPIKQLNTVVKSHYQIFNCEATDAF